MTAIKSLNFISDFVCSEKAEELFSLDELAPIKESVDDLSKLWEQKQESHGAFFLSRQEVKQLKATFREENAFEFQRIDEFASLFIYRYLFKLKPEEEVAADSLTVRLGEEFIFPHWFPLEFNDEERALHEKFVKWCKETDSQSFCCWKTDKVFRDSEQDYDLERQIEKAKSYSKTISELDQLDEETINTVYYLFKERCYRGIFFPSWRPVLVLKGCSSGSEGKQEKLATAHLEVLMYEFAQTLGIDRFFVPTKMETIETNNDKYEGSVQPFVHGGLLSVYLEDGCFPDIEFNDYVDAIFASLVMSVGDGHANNVMIDEKSGLPKYFDNSRSMMHSNGVVRLESGLLMLSYFNELLLMSEAFDAMTATQKAKMKKKIEEHLHEKTRNTLSNTITEVKKKFLFPRKWLLPDQCIAAFSERMQRLNEKIDQCVAPIDLVFAADPIHKHLLSLSFAIEYSRHGEHVFRKKGDNPFDDTLLPDFVDLKGSLSGKHMHRLMMNIYGNGFVDSFFEEASKEELSAKEIFEISTTTTNWRVWVEAIIKYVDHSKGSKIDKNQLKQENRDTLGEVYKHACEDFRDPSNKGGVIDHTLSKSI